MYIPRYLCYCSVHNKTPEEMMKHDEEKWPGGKMCGFLLWNRDQINSFLKEFPKHNFHGTFRNEQTHLEYDLWLSKKYGASDAN